MACLDKILCTTKDVLDRIESKAFDVDYIDVQGSLVIVVGKTRLGANTCLIVRTTPDTRDDVVASIEKGTSLKLDQKLKTWL